MEVKYRGSQLVFTVVLQSETDPNDVVQVVKVFTEANNELNYNVNRFLKEENRLVPITGDDAVPFILLAFPGLQAPAPVAEESSVVEVDAPEVNDTVAPNAEGAPT
jgi:hypothetical protein